MSPEPSVWMPKGDPPPRGWPVLVFLHGCGGTGNEHAPHAIAATEFGLAGITLPGPIRALGSGYAWPADGFRTTHEYLRDTLARCQGRLQFNPSQRLLCGFSQGATHVIGLLSTEPAEYAAGIALSPGEGPPIPDPDRTQPGRAALYVAHGAREFPVFRKKAKRCEMAWRRAGWPILLETHSGSHHMPYDWATRFPRIIRWFTEQDRLRQAVL
jgi:predicted esterase